MLLICCFGFPSFVRCKVGVFALHDYLARLNLECKDRNFFKKTLRDEKIVVYLQANRDGGALVASRTAPRQIEVIQSGG